ncbi:hypothetical protein TcWFU_005661 [Taenia crassiceps]|uniref:Uncharacterized protein n=1 Tax=Taenia crassiceps TaxID=6207 RepID=A0ABR4QR76_9CEST
MSDRRVCPSMEANDVTGLGSKSTSLSVHVKGCVGGSSVSQSSEKRYSRRQTQRAVPDGDTWDEVQSVRKRQCSNISDDDDFSRENVMPSGDSANNNGRYSDLGNVEPHKKFEPAETASVRSSMSTDPPNTAPSTSSAQKTPKNHKVLHSTRVRFPSTSAKGNVNDDSTKKFGLNLHLSSYLRPNARKESKAPDEGILDKVVRYCYIKNAHNQRPHKHGHIFPKPKTKRSRLNKQPRETLPTPNEECRAICSDLSTVTSVSSMQRSWNTKNASTICQDEGENEDQLVMQISAKVQHMRLSSEDASTPGRDTIATESHPTLLVTSPELGVRHWEEKGNLLSLSPIDEVNTLTSATDVLITHKPRGCEGDVRAEVILADGAKQEASPGFGSQSFMHFTTKISPPLRKMIRIVPGIIQKNITPQLTPYSQVTRCMPIKSQLRMGRPHKRYQVAPSISVVMASKNRIFLRKQFIKKSFFLPESANLEDILADADDRRIVAICNRFHCEMVAFSKVPRKGFMKHEVILSAGCRDDIAKCARCLDARLNWCISPQLD